MKTIPYIIIGCILAAAWTESLGDIVQEAYLKASTTHANDNFGFCVAVSTGTAVVGAWQEGSNATGVNGNQTNRLALDSGAAYVFARQGVTWTQQAYLKASNTGAGDLFGTSVAISCCRGASKTGQIL